MTKPKTPADYKRTAAKGMTLLLEGQVPDRMIRIDSLLGLDGAIGLFEDCFCIFFLGSNELKDWALNFMVCTEDGYHSGFLASYKLVENLIKEAYEELAEFMPIVVSGHSNGGAVAYHAALSFATQGKDVTLITYGQPRLLKRDRIGEEKIIKTYYRYHNPLDPVTYLPPFLSHVGTPKKKQWLGLNPHKLKSYLA